MPSANPKLEKQASTEATDPIRQAIIVIEHKIRNLEKRKSKLESYREIQKTGKELNHDQKIAVAKYDEVLQTLDITRDLCKQIVSIANDFAKQQKKIARKEALERTQQEVSKVREVLLIQDVLMNIGGETIREDFLTGSNGASKLTQDDLKYLDDLYGEVTVKRVSEPGELPFAQQLQKAAEHYVAIVDGKQRDVVGTTYIKLKEIITSVNQCGYFDQVQAQETESAVEIIAEAPTEAVVTEASVPEPSSDEYNVGDTHIPPPESMIPMPTFPVQVTPVPVVSGNAAVAGPIPVVAPPQAIPPHGTAPVDTYYANATGYVPSSQPNQQQQPQQTPRINDVIGTPNFFFLQESELDSPDVTGQQQQQQQQPPPPPPTIVSHIPPAVNAPIPTQTFTNQNFGGAPVVPVAQQVIYQHPPQEMPHIPGFANPNPPPPIPMPPSHQQQNMQYSPQHPTGFQPQQPGQSIQSQAQQPPQQQQPQQNFESRPQQDVQPDSTEDKNESRQDESGTAAPENDHQNEQVDWCQMTETPVDEWVSNDTHHQQSGHQDQQTQQQAWGEQRSGYRGRGGRRGNSNGYNGRGRGGGGGGGSGGYQQNGRASGGQGSYYRNNDSNYQNGYQSRNYNNDGNSNYNGNFKRGGGRGGPRGGGGDRTNMDRGGNSRGGQFRGQRGGGGNRGTYVPRGKPQTQQ